MLKFSYFSYLHIVGPVCEAAFWVGTSSRRQWLTGKVRYLYALPTGQSSTFIVHVLTSAKFNNWVYCHHSNFTAVNVVPKWTHPSCCFHGNMKWAYTVGHWCSFVASLKANCTLHLHYFTTWSTGHFTTWSTGLGWIRDSTVSVYWALYKAATSLLNHLVQVSSDRIVYICTSVKQPALYCSHKLSAHKWPLQWGSTV